MIRYGEDAFRDRGWFGLWVGRGDQFLNVEVLRQADRMRQPPSPQHRNRWGSCWHIDARLDSADRPWKDVPEQEGQLMGCFSYNLIIFIEAGLCGLGFWRLLYRQRQANDREPP